MIFGPLKIYWTQERDTYERNTGQKVSKSNFLKIYAAAHVQAFTMANIQAAFRKTGLIPFDPTVITKAMMAPSIETSCKSSLPLIPSTPIRYINAVFQELARPQQPQNAENDAADTPSHLVQIAAAAALHDLSDTAVGFLYADQPVQSTSELPPLPTALISPRKPHHTDLLLTKATTDMEQRLQQALHDANSRDMYQKGIIVGLQSAAVLQGKYCETVRSQLAGDEEKKKATKKGRLMGDGLPRLLTDPDFIAQVAKHDDNQAREVAEKAARKRTRIGRKAELEAWTEAKAVRKEANLKLVAGWKLEVAGWEQTRTDMKNNGKTRGWGKAPPRPKMVPAIPRPGVQMVTEDASGEDDTSSCSEDEDEDE